MDNIEEYKKKPRMRNSEAHKAYQKKYRDEHKKTAIQYRLKNAESIKAKNKRYRAKKSEHIKENMKIYYLEHIQHFKNKSKNYYVKNKEAIKKYRAENYEVIKEQKREYQRNRLKTNTAFRVQHNIRRRLNHFFESSKTKKPNKTSDMLGCTWEFLMDYLAERFKEGMTRENHGHKGWHIDHIIPLSSAKCEEEVKRLCHYTNLQPLWWWENLAKSNKL